MDARLGGIAVPAALLRYVLGSDLRRVVSLVHHQGDQLCIYRPEEEAREIGVEKGLKKLPPLESDRKVHGMLSPELPFKRPEYFFWWRVCVGS